MYVVNATHVRDNLSTHVHGQVLASGNVDDILLIVAVKETIIRYTGFIYGIRCTLCHRYIHFFFQHGVKNSSEKS